MKRQCVLAMMLVLLVLPLGISKQQVALDVVSSFKELTARHIASYENDQRVQVGQYGGYDENMKPVPLRWRRAWFRIESKYSVDVQSTNSLISPYVGIFEFKLHGYLSKMRDTKEEAEKELTAETESLIKHKHIFAYQDKKWVPTDRKHFTEEPLSPVESMNKWWDCDEITSGGKTNIFGCKEDLTAKPVPTPIPKPQMSRPRKRPHNS